LVTSNSELIINNCHDLLFNDNGIKLDELFRGFEQRELNNQKHIQKALNSLDGIDEFIDESNKKIANINYTVNELLNSTQNEILDLRNGIDSLNKDTKHRIDELESSIERNTKHRIDELESSIERDTKHRIDELESSIERDITNRIDELNWRFSISIEELKKEFQEIGNRQNEFYSMIEATRDELNSLREEHNRLSNAFHTLVRDVVGGGCRVFKRCFLKTLKGAYNFLRRLKHKLKAKNEIYQEEISTQNEVSNSNSNDNRLNRPSIRYTPIYRCPTEGDR